MNDVAHFARENTSPDRSLDDVAAALRSIQCSIHANHNLKCQLNTAEADKTRLQEEAEHVCADIQIAKTKNVELAAKLAEHVAIIAEQRRIISEQGRIIVEQDRKCVEQEQKIVGQEREFAKQHLELQRKVDEQRLEEGRKANEQCVELERRFGEQLAEKNQIIFERGCELAKQKEEAAERERMLIQQFTKDERKIIEQFTEHERKLVEHVTEQEQKCAEQERKRVEQLAEQARRFSEQERKSDEEYKRKAADQEARNAEHDAKYASLQQRNQLLIADYDAKYAELQQCNQKVLSEHETKYAELEYRTKVLVAEHEVRCKEWQLRTQALEDEIQVMMDNASASVTERLIQWQAQLLDTQRKAVLLRCRSPKVITFAWTLWRAIVKASKHEDKIQRNALSRCRARHSERLLNGSFARWKVMNTLAAKRRRFKKQITLHASVRVLFSWRIITSKNKSIRRHFRALTYCTIYRALRTWSYASKRTHDAQRHYTWRAAESVRRLKRACFLRWIAMDRKGSKRLDKCLAVFACLTWKIRLRKKFVAWRDNVRKTRFAGGFEALINHHRWSHLARSLLVRAQTMEGFSALSETLFRYPFSGTWRLMRQILQAWWNIFRPEHEVQQMFYGWRMVMAAKKMSNARISMAKMKAYAERCEDKMSKCAAQAKQALSFREEAMQDLNATRHMLKNQVEDTYKWSTNCAEFHRKTMELEGERQGLKNQVEELQKEIDMLQLEAARKRRRCAACTAESARFLRAGGAKKNDEPPLVTATSRSSSVYRRPSSARK